MPFCREKVENSAVNYRGAKKIGGAKTRSGSVERGTDIAKIKPKIGNTHLQTRQVKDLKAAILPLSYCIHTTNQHNKPSVYAVSQPDTPQFVANLSLISCYPAIVVACWWCPGRGVQMKHIPDTCQVFLLYTPRDACQGKILDKGLHY